MKVVKIGILGVGTVGGGVVNVLTKNSEEISNKCGVKIKVIIGCVKDKLQPLICDSRNLGTLTDNVLDVINSDADIILELIGGTTIAKDLIIQALNSGKNVVTANKALIATHGNELLELAKTNGVKLLFEAAVAGGIPILKSIEQGLSANKIEKIAGIINGTGNFIMSKMRDEGLDFNSVLSEAQELGYAEADPTFDIEGIDAAHKLTILTSMAFGTKLSFAKVSTIGIGHITSEDIILASELGFQIKHLALSSVNDNKISMSVNPTLIPKTKLLANVNGVMNAIMVKGNAIGETMYYGAGAGSDATASSIIADIMDIVNNTTNDNILGWHTTKDFDFVNTDEVFSSFYLKFRVVDEKGVLANITKILAEFNISIEKMLQKESSNSATIVIITNIVETKLIIKAIDKIGKQSFNQEKIQFIHVENLN